MAQLNDQTLKALLDKGAISPETYSLAQQKKPDVFTSIIPQFQAPMEAQPEASSQFVNTPLGKEAAKKAQAEALTKKVIEAEPEVLTIKTPEEVVGKKAPQAEIVVEQPKEKQAVIERSPAAAPVQTEEVVLASDLTKPTQASSTQRASTQSLSDAYDKQMKAIEMAGIAGAAEATAQSAYMKTTADQMQRLEQQRQTRANAREQESKKQLMEFEKVKEGLMSSPEIDPNRYMSSMDAGQKMKTNIALILGGFGAGGSARGENKVATMLQKQIDRDIEVQKANYDKKKDVFNAQNTIFSKMMEVFNDQQQAETAARVAALDIAKLNIDRIAAQYKSPQVMAQALKAVGEIEAKQQMDLAELQKQIQSSTSVSQAGEAAQKIMQLPKELQKEGFEQLGKYKAIQAKLKQVGGIFEEQKNLQSLGSRISSPIQSKSQLEKSSAQLFPIVKEILGERMTEGDVQNFLKPYTVKFTDSEQTIAKKKKDLMDALNLKLLEQTSMIQDFNVVPKAVTLQAPVK